MSNTVDLEAFRESLRRGWKVGLVVALLVVLAGAVLAVRPFGTYSSTASLYIATKVDSQDAEELSQRSAIAAARTLTYVRALSGNVFADEVAREVGGEIETDHVIVTASPSTTVIDVTVQDPDPDRSREVAAAYAEAAPGLIQDLEGTRDGGWQVEVSLIDQAEEGEFTGRVGPLLTVLLSLVLAAGAGLSAALSWGMLRRSWRGAGAPPAG